ncbi:nuclear transport factor 2 family protein [Halovenus halobia]|uniref:nuclear transport factor 2 family protein n=1 Tax=Halovenus halobia TaxID=3396622 RepID=UPI003F57B105
MTDGEKLARAYYDCLDSGEYDRLAELLAPGFVQKRPDKRFGSREEFIEFMRDQRPRTDTTHPLDRIYQTPAGSELAVKGRLVADGETLTGFVDLFTLRDGQVERIETYVD